jgi:hypothetical protein
VRGIGALGASSESSRALNLAGGDSQALGEPLLTLDDAAEDMERESINVGVSSALEALMNATGLLRDVVTPAGQVPCDPASRPSSRWIFVSLTHVSHSLLWLIAGRSPGSCVSTRTPSRGGTAARGGDRIACHCLAEGGRADSPRRGGSQPSDLRGRGPSAC